MKLTAQMLAIVSALVLSAADAPGARIFVDASAVLVPHNGSSWGRAYLGLQEAILAAGNGDEIWVANGRYTPANHVDPSPRLQSFVLKNGVRIYGGFHGGLTGETSLAQRNPLTNPTILSGDINADDLPNFANRSDNSLHVVLAPESFGAAALDGFIIEGGNANLASEPLGTSGGGAKINGGSANFVNCWFRGNEAAASGGAASAHEQCSVDFTGCVFTGNRAATGSALALTICSASLFSCTVTGNSIVGSSPAGAVFASNCLGMRVHASILWGNTNSFGQPQNAQVNLLNNVSNALSSVDVQGGTGGLPGLGLFSAVPGFMDADGADNLFGTADDDVRLRALSPCIDSADTDLLQSDLSDMDGDGETSERVPYTIGADPRVHDDPGSPNPPVAHPGVDLGAHEFQESSCVGNLNADTVVNTADLTVFLTKFGQSVPPYTLGDFNGDATVNTADLTLLLSRFGAACPS